MSVPPCELTKDLLESNPGFDYEGSKAKYFLAAYAQQPPAAYEYLHITKERYAHIVNYLLERETAVTNGIYPPRLFRRQKCLRMMELYREGGDIYVIKKRASPDEPIIKHLTIEDSFDVFLNLHLKHKHCRRDKLRRLVKQQYEICLRYSDIFVKSCNICSAWQLRTVKGKDKPAVKQTETKRDVSLEMDGEKKFLLDIFNMEVPDGEFKYVLFCKDMCTSYLFLRPLIEKCHKEVATELLQIVMTFGSPGFSILTRSRNQDFFLNTIIKMNQFGLNLNSFVENLSDGRHRDLFCNAKWHLESWMKTKNSNNWGLGCHVVQWQLNNMQYRNKKGDWIKPEETPYFNMFSQRPVYPPISKDNDQQSILCIASEDNIASEDSIDSEGNIARFKGMFETMSHPTNASSSITSEDTPKAFSYSAEEVKEYLKQHEAITENIDDTS